MKLLNYDTFFIALTLAFCLHATYTDLKYRKIRNLCSFGLIYAGFMAQILFLIQGKITLFTMGSICFGGSLIALFLYWLNILAPGDAKLLLGIFLALPPSLFQDAAGKVGVQQEFLHAAQVREEIASSQYATGLLSFQDWDLIEDDLIANQKAMLASQRDALIGEATWERAQGRSALP